MQEELEKVLLPVFAADGGSFVPAGREDIDVRMLGTGRPFVYEVHNARNRLPSRFVSPVSIVTVSS
jgi:tRNA pseudouridine synthase 10